MCCCSSVDSTKTTLVIRGLLGLALFVRAQMADEADPCTEGSGTEGTRDEWDISRRVDSTGLLGLPLLFCGGDPVGLA